MAKLRPTVDDVLNSDQETTIEIAGNVTVYTKSFPLWMAEHFALAYKLASTGVMDVTIELEECWTIPATEGSADGNYVEPENMADVHANLADATQHIKALNPVVAPYGRFKLAGGGANDASTTARLRLIKQEEV